MDELLVTVALSFFNGVLFHDPYTTTAQPDPKRVSPSSLPSSEIYKEFLIILSRKSHQTYVPPNTNTLYNVLLSGHATNSIKQVQPQRRRPMTPVLSFQYAALYASSQT